jgi:hypothetical protein
MMSRTPKSWRPGESSAPPSTTPATPIALERMATTSFIWASLQRLRYVVPRGSSFRDAAITISAILLVIMTLRITRTAADGDPQPDYDSGSLTLT